MKTPVREQVERLSAAAYFKLLAELLKQNPPAAADAPILARMATLGIVPGKDFDLDKIPPAIGWSLREAARVGAKKIHDYQDSAGIKVNGWTYPGRPVSMARTTCNGPSSPIAASGPTCLKTRCTPRPASTRTANP